MKRLSSWVLGLVLGALPLAAADKLSVTATTTMVGDLARSLGGERVEVTTLMGPGVDPHLYKATAGDGPKLRNAKLILYSGLHLEGKMQDVFDGMAKGSGRHVVAVASGIPSDRLLKPDGAGEHPDPHIWFDVELWSLCARSAATALTGADPAGKAFYEKKLADYQKRLADLHAWAKKRAMELPQGRRVLITSHDAFSYFGRAYGFKVIGLQGISTVSEAGGADMVKMVDFIKQRGVKAIFVESSVSHQALERISKDSGARIGGELFSDAMGTPGQIENGYDLGTYEGMIRHNLNTVVEALR